MLVLHHGTPKQSLHIALAIFEESTVAAILMYFQPSQHSAEFLTLFHRPQVVLRNEFKNVLQFKRFFRQ